MTTSSKIRSELPAASAAAPRCEEDLYGWVEHQVALLRAGRMSEIDAAKAFELACPYDWDAILSRVVEFEGIRSPEK